MTDKKQTCNRQSWSEEDMSQAMQAVRSKEMGWLLAAKTFNVPKSTLRRRVNDKNKVLHGSKKGFLGGSVSVFSEEVESELVNHIKSLESRFFGLTCTDVRKIAFQLAEKLKLKHNFNREKKAAGWDWLNGFIKRHPTISIRQPEATSLARAQAFNKITIGKYFSSLKNVMDEYNFQPDQIYNVDESGLSTVQSRTEKILATKGRKQVGSLTSAERGQHFTVVCCMNAMGNYIPPAMIFPRKNMKAELLDNTPPGCVGFPQESGWMTGQVFVLWLKHFIKFAKPSAEKKFLLLLDGHSSHKHLEVLELAKENNIILFCFPPHCTHRVQPLDVSFYGPLTTYYNQALRRWLHAHPGRNVTHFQVGQLFNEAYLQAATLANAVHGFQKTGIYPFNEDIFPEWQFHPSETTDQSLEINQSELPATREAPIPVKLQDKSSLECVPSSSSESTRQSTEKSSQDKENVRNVSSLLLEVSPIPHATACQKRKRKGGAVGIINRTPDLDAAKSKAAEKKQVEQRKSERSVKKVLKELASENSENEDPFATGNDEQDDDDDPACIYCNSLFSLSKSKERWIQCQECHKWCHNECAGVEPKRKMFICELCID